ncbi:hypothetical protein ACLB2K_044261 [Fragaria x ananassa]
MPSSLGYQPPSADQEPVTYVHTLSEAGRLLPSASRWNSIEIDFNLVPQSEIAYDVLPSGYSKSYDHNLVIRDRKLFKRCLYISASIVILFLALILLLRFLPHKHHHHGPSKNLTLALNQALTFFDAQKSGTYPQNSPVKFRGDSGLQDGNSTGNHVNLVGGFYDSGNNIKFSFSTAYTMTLLSWTVIEYHQKYADIGELDHVKDIIKWGSDYLLKVFVPPNATSDTTLYSQASLMIHEHQFCTKIFSPECDNMGLYDGTTPSDINCWERPEDMDYERPVSICDSTASDLAGEIVAALSAASLVFKSDDSVYSGELVKAAGELFESATKDPNNQGTYTRDESCGGQSRDFYNSSGYNDELAAVDSETSSDKWIFDWNNKLTANMVLLTRLQFFHDLGYPYEGSLMTSANMTGSLMCSYVSSRIFNMTPGGLVIQRPNYGAPLQFAATASFLSKLYSDYLDLLLSSGGSCSTGEFTVDMLRNFSLSQASITYNVNYILGDNPMNMSYMVGFGDKFPSQVHHRSASIPWDGQHYLCKDGYKWRDSKDPNPNVLLGAMVGGPDEFDKFIDERDRQEFTEPRITSNAGLVAALIALHDPPHTRKNKKKGHYDPTKLGIDQMGIFDKIH